MKNKILSTISAALILASCANFYTQQPTENIALIELGMNSKQVLDIMGVPEKTEFNDYRRVLHYCSTGYNIDKFAKIILVSGKVITAKNYTLTTKDVNEDTGDCSDFIKSETLMTSPEL